jgi:hypothetical protein
MLALLVSHHLVCISQVAEPTPVPDSIHHTAVRVTRGLVMPRTVAVHGDEDTSGGVQGDMW